MYATILPGFDYRRLPEMDQTAASQCHGQELRVGDLPRVADIRKCLQMLSMLAPQYCNQMQTPSSSAHRRQLCYKVISKSATAKDDFWNEENRNLYACNCIIPYLSLKFERSSQTRTLILITSSD